MDMKDFGAYVREKFNVTNIEPYNRYFRSLEPAYLDQFRNAFEKSGTHAVNVSLFPTMPYDPIKDFTPIVHLLDAEGLLVVNPSLPPTTVPELISFARSQPGKRSKPARPSFPEGMGTRSEDIFFRRKVKTGRGQRRSS